MKSTDPSCATKLKVLADATRLGVLESLLHGPKTVSELLAAMEVEQSLLSHHLAVLRETGLVEARRLGKQMVYQLSPPVVDATTGNAINLGCCMICFR
ncbi:MAG: ArsR family transcriptional regulator [Nitrospirae bacterium]|nr:MAG: ArsR family transcriptional regulator [Nitrospirota bacterium]